MLQPLMIKECSTSPVARCICLNIAVAESRVPHPAGIVNEADAIPVCDEQIPPMQVLLKVFGQSGDIIKLLKPSNGYVHLCHKGSTWFHHLRSMLLPEKESASL